MPLMNEIAFKLATEMIDNSDTLNIRADKLPCGATIIDAGVNIEGSLEAGKYSVRYV